MTPIIQMIYTGDDNYIFLKGFNEKDELVFRTSRMPKYLQNEKIIIDKDMVYTNLYHFPTYFLRHLITTT